MKTNKRNLVASALILAVAVIGTSTSALAGGGHSHRHVDHGHHGAHGKWHDSAQDRRANASRGAWHRHDHRLTPRQRAKLKKWRRRVVREYSFDGDHRLTRRQWARIEQWRDRLDRDYRVKPRRIVRPARPIRHRHRHWHRSKHRHAGSAPQFLNGGTAVGAIAGGLIGNQIGSGRGRVLATVGGALLGAIVGNGVYQGIRASDEERVARVLESTPSGQTVAWKNPDTGNSFRVTPSPAFKDADQRDCREYKTWAFIDGYEKELSGVACRDSHGRWQLMNG